MQTPPAASTVASSAARSSKSAALLLRESLVWDNHGCMPVGRPHDTSFLPRLQRYRDAGVNVVMLNIGFGDMGVEEHLRTLAGMRHWLLARPNEFVLIGCVEDIEQAHDSGRLAVGFDIEGANAIADQISLIELYRDLGVRWMLLAYNLNNRVGGGCQDVDPGLSDFGRRVVAEMERVGMQVCLSHTGHRTAHEVLAMARKPVMFSHSNPSAVHAHPRNIPDDLIRACAATGGVVGINGVGIFLGDNDTSSATFARHVDHVVQLVGPEHAALGLDYVFDMQELNDFAARMRHTFPPGMGYDTSPKFVAPEQLEEIVQILSDWGYGTTALQAVLGGNLMRLARANWCRPVSAANT